LEKAQISFVRGNEEMSDIIYPERLDDIEKALVEINKTLLSILSKCKEIDERI
jgi:hypothetical protein